MFIDDKDVWHKVNTDDLWIYDKLIVAKKQGLQAAPAGIPVPKDNWYIIRPITNLRMMSRGARKIWLTPNDTDQVPDGYFWCEWLEGRHITVDYLRGVQTVAAEGFRDSERLDRFSRWVRLDEDFTIPKSLGGFYLKYKWVNFELIGDKVIEIHLRYNDDFAHHSYRNAIPVWRDEQSEQPEGSIWYDCPSGDRLGFWIY
jgi:hypothetical protein